MDEEPIKSWTRYWRIDWDNTITNTPSATDNVVIAISTYPPYHLKLTVDSTTRYTYDLKPGFLQTSLHNFVEIVVYFDGTEFRLMLIDNVSRFEESDATTPPRVSTVTGVPRTPAVACSKLCIDDLRQTGPRVLNEPPALRILLINMET